MELALNLKPSRPRSAYNFFVKDMYESGEVKGFGNVKILGNKWDKLSDDNKEKFLRLAKKERLIYIIKKRNYDQMIRKDKGKAPSAYNLYLQDHAGESKTLTDLYKVWKKESAEVKKKYQKRLKALEQNGNLRWKTTN